ncbi:MAG: hypothetical protein IT480_13200 [Gammaproteobacteria bacterium]|nr:hypothetical protein [Gammaproteobacteria bacterium]
MLNRNRFIALGALLLLAVSATWWWTRERGEQPPAAVATRPEEAPASEALAVPGTAPGANPQWESGFVRGADAPTLAAEQLTDFLPAELAGLQRTDVARETSAGADTPIQTVKARYASSDGQVLELRIADLGGPRGVGVQAAWALVGDQDNSGPEGYERTRTLDGRHHYERWDSVEGTGEQAVLLGERLSVSVSGNPADASSLGAALGQVDLVGLERLVRP